MKSQSLSCLKFPRFGCIPVVNPRDGPEHWKPVDLNLDDHIFVHSNNRDHDHEEEPATDEDVVNSFLADLAISSPMSMKKPLWELHVMHEQKCIITRIHHAIADGMSLMSLLWTMGRPKGVSNDQPQHMITDSKNLDSNASNKHKDSKKSKGLWDRLKYIWYSLVFGLIFMLRCTWLRDKSKVISGIEGVEFWPRKVATAKFKLSDMKTIRKAIPNATIHDVLFGVLWCGFSRYFNIQYPKYLKDGVQITGMCPVNLREQPGVQDVSSMLKKDTRTPWGNRFSMIILPIRYMKRDLGPLAYVTLAKEVMNRKKQSMEARLSYNIASLTSALFGCKVAGSLYYNLFRNTSFVISNMAGPTEDISIAGNPVTLLRVTSSSQPHAMTMHMVSYQGRADLQVQVAKEVIPDPKFLAKCFEDALLDMKEAAESSISQASMQE